MVGADRFKEIFEKYNTRPILLYGDPDVDGLYSLLFMAQFCDMFGLQYSYYVNDERYHGLAIPATKLKGYLVIASDFSITRSECEAMVENDVVLLSTDHHEIESRFIDVVGETAEAIVINNQYPFEPEEDRYLSGAGVFYELVCSIYPEFKSPLRKALVGVTLLSDIRQIENPKARSYLKATYSVTDEPYIKYLLDSTVDKTYDFGVPKMDRNFVDFTLSPIINAMLRANKTQEAINFVLGYGLSSSSDRDFQRYLVEQMMIYATVSDFPNIAVLTVQESDFYDLNVHVSRYIGLLCSSYKDSHDNKSVLGMAVDNGKIERVSFRGRYDDIPYRTGFLNLGVNAQGHPTAFGIQDFKPYTELWTEIDDMIGDLEANHSRTCTIVDVNNLAGYLTRNGAGIATQNCYVRDMYRTYIKYTGNNAKIVKETYRMDEFSSEDYASGAVPDVTKNGISYRYELDSAGNKIPKYIEYLIDGRKVKSFGVHIEDGVILPVLENGYIQLYVRPAVA